MNNNRLPSGGYDHTQRPTQRQVDELERLTGYDCQQFRGTRRQASVYIESLRSKNQQPLRHLAVKNWLLALGCIE